MNNPEQGSQDWDTYVAPIKAVAQQLQEQMKNLKTRDVLKFGTKILIQRKVENKMFSALHKYYDGALSKAKELAKKGLQKLPSQNPQMVTPDGVIIEGTHDAAKETLHLQKKQQLNPDKAANWGNRGKTKTPARVINQSNYITTKEATEVAKKLGYRKTKYISEGRPVYTNGKNYITPDRTTHNGGFWKKAKLPKELKGKNTRAGTYDINLNLIGD